VKDRARPFSRKHFRYWMTAAGGMVIIMAVNVGLGFWLFARPRPPADQPHYLPIPEFGFDAAQPLDAGAALDAGTTLDGGGAYRVTPR
jgi:hypothetical protein